MKINNNITAYITNNSLLKSEKMFANSTAKLSSGFKINKAGDDPTGYAISNRMRAQLEALDRSDVNSTTGRSVLETADASLSEVTDMVQRLNELSIKAANGSLSSNDRQTIQDEVDSLRDEIVRISKETQLNDQNLFDGTLENTGYCETNKEIRVDGYNEKTKAGTYENVSIDEQTSGDKLTVTVSGFPEGETTTMEFDYPQYYDEDKIDTDGKSLAVTTGLYVDGSNKGSVKICADGSQLITINGNEGQSLTLNISAKLGKKDSTEVTKDGVTYVMDQYQISTSSETLTLTGKGTLSIQSGANEEEKIECSLPKISLERLNLDDMDVTTEKGATKAISKVKDALTYLNAAHSKIGAYQNRVEHNIAYLEASNENLTAAMSRIKDTDMASEMTNYASQQVLTQAATSMLAQANQAPQQVLQLLQ
ncbi:MAG: hypothetical protein K5989_00920, partial [Lachnospiraceae bacterium]|nr:hypothetical protein [Lachnospiraceae bacterium]